MHEKQFVRNQDVDNIFVLIFQRPSDIAFYDDLCITNKHLFKMYLNYLNEK